MLASLISILVGLIVGTIVVVIVGLTKDTITPAGIWDGVRLIFAGILSTGRNAAGQLTWGYNAQSLGNMLFRATPLIMTGLSVAVAYKIFAGILSTGRNAAGQLTWGYNAQSLGNMLFRATPLIMTGLSVAVAYKTGLFNIGAPGQYLMGTMTSLMIALGIPSDVVPAGLIWVLAFLGGCIAGALWGAIPGLLKAFLNINEARFWPAS